MIGVGRKGWVASWKGMESHKLSVMVPSHLDIVGWLPFGLASLIGNKKDKPKGGRVHSGEVEEDQEGRNENTRGLREPNRDSQGRMRDQGRKTEIKPVTGKSLHYNE
jgi:hypothetical protein